MSQFFASDGQRIGVSTSASVLSMNIHSGLISFRNDGLDLLAVQGTLKECSPTPQFKSINSSRSAFFTVQFSHPYMTTGKAIALTRWTFVGNVSAFEYAI